MDATLNNSNSFSFQDYQGDQDKQDETINSSLSSKTYNSIKIEKENKKDLYCKPGIIFGFIDLKEVKIYEDFLDEEGNKFKLNDILKYYIVENLNDEIYSKKFECQYHNNKYEKYCIKCKKHSCQKCFNNEESEEEHKNPEDLIELKLDNDLSTLLNNFINSEIGDDKEEYNFYIFIKALNNTFILYPNIENYISLIKGIKLILELDNLFKYINNDNKPEEINRYILKEKMILIEFDLENKLNKKIVYCDCCNSSVQFLFHTENKIETIGDKAIKQFDLDYCEKLIKSDILKICSMKNIKPKFEYKNMYCLDHQNKKFKAYCTDCKKNRCEDCLIYINENSHKLLHFHPPNFKMEKYLKYGIKFCRFINALANTFKEYPNIYSYQSLESAEKLLSNKNEQNKNIEEGKIIEEFNSLSRHKIKNKEEYKKIKVINFESKNIRSLKYIGKLNLINLRKLGLKGNFIDSIKWLLKCEFLDNLKVLDLSSNNLGDFNIKYFKKLSEKNKLKNLEELYLHANKFENFSLFDYFQFQNLKILFLGFNYFRNNPKNIVDEKKEYNFEKLEQFGLSAVFRQDNIGIIKNMKLNSIRSLYLQNNDIEDISFLSDMKIENNNFQINLNYNNLTEIDIESLLIYKNLKRIIFEGNYINKIINIEKIDEFKIRKQKIQIDFSSNYLDKKTKEYLKSKSDNNVIIKV